ncbi:hypothetical protein AHAS_Ahas01G0163600 [Arachis hypogaea]
MITLMKSPFFLPLHSQPRPPSSVGVPPATALHPELAPASSVLLRPQLSRQNSSDMVSEPFWKGRVVTFLDNFDDEEQDDVDGSRADGNRTLSQESQLRHMRRWR